MVKELAVTTADTTRMDAKQQQQQLRSSFGSSDHRQRIDPDSPAPAIPRRSRMTEETSSDVHSAYSSDGAYEVIEYDLPHDHDRMNGGGAMSSNSSSIFLGLGNINIHDDSPAGAALRANASVHVSSVGKVARAVHMQAVRRVLKRAAGKSKSGNIKGKPPRVPPKIGPSTLAVYKEDEDDDEDDDDDEDHYHDANERIAIDDDEDDTGHEDDHIWSSPPSSPQKKTMVLDGKKGGGGDDGNHDNCPFDEIEDSSHNNNSKPRKETATSSEKQMDMDIPDGIAPGTVEAGKKVLRSVDPHDLLKLVRWKRKKKGDSMKNTKSYVKGKVIDGEHELYTLSIAVMIGVRTSISRTNTVMDSLLPAKRWVNSIDFKTTQKYEFHPKGDGPLPPHQLAHTFKFKDYCPVVFAYLRRMYGVNEFDFLLSISGNANFIEFISNAKSGQFFFYSGDGRYMIKTMTNAESKLLRRMLPDYFKHCCENPNTMITRFFGMYRVKLYHLRRNVKFVIMNSVYYTDKHLQTFYDLKGSSVGRDAKPGQAVMKDNDLRRGLPDQAFVLRPPQRKAVRDQIEADCEFLRSMGVMDYSMLVGIHHIPPFESRASMTFRKSKMGRSRRNTAPSMFSPTGDDSETMDSDFMSLRKNNNRGGGPSRNRTNTGSSLTLNNNHNLDDSEVSDYDPSPNGTSTIQESSVSSSVADFMPSKSHRRSSSGQNNRTRADTLGSFVTHSFEDGSEDDENSYLAGSNNRLSGTSHNTTTPRDEKKERQKQATVERLFWPFHHLYDIHGHRRHQPLECNVCGSAPCSCEDSDWKLLHEYKIPKFVAPLSDRKDGGFEMDTTGRQLPMKGKGPTGDILYEGKIFYMGIIDVLQEYGSRKELESLYRMMRAPDRMAASCVPPKDYGRRFLNFFDTYTQGGSSAMVNKDEEGVEVSVRI